MIATSGFLTPLECTKFVFGRGSILEPRWGTLQRSQTPSWFKGAVLLRAGNGKKVERLHPAIPAYAPGQVF